MTRTTTIARSVPRSISPRTLSCRRRRNCRCRLFLDQSSTSIASRSVSSCRGELHFNHALHRSPDLRLLLIFGIAARVFRAGDVRRIERDRLLHISMCRVSTTARRAGRLAIPSRIRNEASCLFMHTAPVAGISWAARRCSRSWRSAAQQARKPRLSSFPRSSSRAQNQSLSRGACALPHPHRRHQSRPPLSLIPKPMPSTSAQQSLYDHRHELSRHQRCHHRRSSRRHQHPGRANPVAGSGGHAGFRRERPTSRSQ